MDNNYEPDEGKTMEIHPRRARKTTVDRLANKIGAEVEMDPKTMYIYSPRGTVFSSTGTSTICIPFRDSFESWKPEAYGEAADLLECGVRDAPEGYRGWWDE